MAYRFLLEVPETLADDASAVVSTVSDAQILVIRNSHGLSFDDPYVDMTISAHSLGVIDHLYGWIDELGLSRPESRVVVGLVLHGGRRLALHEMTRSSVVAAIRRDQPWVDHTLPKIGEHERDVIRADAASPAPPAASTAIATMPSRTVTVHTVLNVDMIDTEDTLTVGGVEYAVVPVLDTGRAERFYRDVFGLQLVQRVRRDSAGGWQEVGPTYVQEQAARDHAEADITFLTNGPLGLALRRMGRAARLDYSRIENAIGISVDAQSAARIKAMVLMRGYTLLGSSGAAFEFRDPFGVAWSIRLAS